MFEKRGTRTIVSLLAVCIALSMLSTPAAAVFYGYDTPPYDDAGTNYPANFNTVAADANAGECEIQVDPLGWPFYYLVGTWSLAWVGADYEMTQTVTQNWYFIGSWDIDYRLYCGWSGKVTISILFQVYNANEDLLQETTAWSHTFQGPPYSWDDVEYDLNDQSTWKTFSADLTNGYTYKFAVALKIHIDYSSGAIDVNARTDHSAPALLEVNSITWTLTPPE